ncbi:hypothetical protein KAU13_08140 [candidate division WOR-3 bacterium]|nr:hypothetical protein [candidate division WOR-3 bacterium]
MEIVIKNDRFYLPDYKECPILIIIKLDSVVSRIETDSRKQVLIKTYSD